MRPLNEILLQGGLGNQMFQYAFYLSQKSAGYECRYNTEWYKHHCSHNGYELDNIFGIPQNNNFFYYHLLRVLRKLRFYKTIPFIKIISDKIPSEYIREFSLKNINLFDGYWQCESYFKTIEKDIRKVFTFNVNNVSPKSKEILYKILNSSAGVSIHVRRGDYLEKKNQELYGNICTIDYYQAAIEEITRRIGPCDFFIFSNDSEWVKTNIHTPNATYIDHNIGRDSWQDMFLMSQCDHNIIANSSFSWWGAWLNSNPDKIVVSPHKFINSGNSNDIIPHQWIRI